MEPIQAVKTAIKQAKNFFDEIEEGKKKEKVFNFFKFTEYCINLSSSTSNGGSHGGYFLRDLVLQTMDKKYTPKKPFKFLGFDCID